MIFKILFYLPTIVTEWVSLLLPFNRHSYKPSSENQRAMSQYMRNKVRLADYYTKRTLFNNHK